LSFDSKKKRRKDCWTFDNRKEAGFESGVKGRGRKEEEGDDDDEDDGE
jgi:hypothetical protein